MKILLHIALIFILTAGCFSSHAQETVFTGMQSNWKKAQKNFSRGSYHEALKYYLAASTQKRTPKEVQLKLGETYVFLSNHEKAVYWFTRYYQEQGDLPIEIHYQLAESLTSLGQYPEAIGWYEQYGKLNPDDSRVMPKIWRLKNINYLYEDSVYYTVSPVPFNTTAAEYAPTGFGDQLIFVSDRVVFGGVQVVDGVNKKPFYKRFIVDLVADSSSHSLSFQKPETFENSFDSKHHHGPISFTRDGQLAVFTQSSHLKDDQGNYPVQLYYVEKIASQWGVPEAINFTEEDHTIRNPSISADGSHLFFSAVFQDGKGRDLYRSSRTPEGWSSPVNLGHKINTPGDEDFPFMHVSGSLFFASNGHGGLGGMDVFEVYLKNDGEIKNLGYPVNTQFDDFGIYLNGSSTNGFLTSNRSGRNDDIFTLEVDLQTYPLMITGALKYRNAQWEEELRVDILAEAEMELIDVYNGRKVYQTHSDNNGKFTLEIPYSSQFKIKINHRELGEHYASLEIPKNKKLHYDHEIVIVEEHFRSDSSVKTDGSR